MHICGIHPLLSVGYISLFVEIPENIHCTRAMPAAAAYQLFLFILHYQRLTENPSEPGASKEAPLLQHQLRQGVLQLRMERQPSHRELNSRVAEAVTPGGAVRRLTEKDYSSSFLFFFITIVTTPAPPRMVTTANGATAIITPVGITPSRVFR